MEFVDEEPVVDDDGAVVAVVVAVVAEVCGVAKKEWEVSFFTAASTFPFTKRGEFSGDENEALELAEGTSIFGTLQKYTLISKKRMKSRKLTLNFKILYITVGDCCLWRLMVLPSVCGGGIVFPISL